MRHARGRGYRWICGFPILVAVLCATLLVAGCGRKEVRPRPGIAPPPPAPSQPSGRRVPATQRPYTINGHTYYPLPSAHGYSATGIASWYGRPFHGRKTACGETYDMHEMTAAHKTLPMQTRLLVRNLDNGRETVVRVNDRGPFVKDRIVDLSLAAASTLGFDRAGTTRVQLTALGEAVPVVEQGKTYQQFLPYRDLNTGEFYVQIGSFTDRNNALRLRDRMENEGRKTVVVTYDRGDQIFHRVQVWGGTTTEVAGQVAQALEAAGFDGAFVVAR
ncbi:MAG: septal ring lytic transglycosylase RlpA family protein [Thermodesulfobacteriota bacterium]